MGPDQAGEGGQGSGRVVGRGDEQADLGIDPQGAVVAQRQMRLPSGEGVPDHAVERVVGHRQ